MATLEAIAVHTALSAAWGDLYDLKQIAHFLANDLTHDVEDDLEGRVSKEKLEARSWAIEKIWKLSDHLDDKLTALMNEAVRAMPGPECGEARH
ncbi:hypothetical protein [Devosia sp. 1635]|uniref:hypothetical protein n=1 Tax=Devosia sp. 1635 TaxID=2726066 RepID=UPI001566EF50|nr:hypothetical protein [Devosia sp. 1635]